MKYRPPPCKVHQGIALFLARTPRPSPASGLTPLPTNSAFSNDDAHIQVYDPTATPGLSACGGDPGDDIFEPDNTASAARDVTGSVSPTLRETHTLRTISSYPPNDPLFDGDNDWVKLRLTANTTYTFSTTNLKPNYPVSVDTVIVLYKGTSPAALTPVNSNDDISSSNLASSLTYTSAAGDTATGVFFYLKVYGKPNASCSGTYDLVINYSTIPTPTIAPTITGTPDTCTDSYESDNAPDQAKELRVSYGTTPPFNGQPGVPDTSTANNNVQSHLICPSADQDWVYFDLVKGKPYSLFTANLSNGLDTMLVLFEQDSAGALNPLIPMMISPAWAWVPGLILWSRLPQYPAIYPLLWRS